MIPIRDSRRLDAPTKLTSPQGMNSDSRTAENPSNQGSRDSTTFVIAMMPNATIIASLSKAQINHDWKLVLTKTSLEEIFLYAALNLSLVCNAVRQNVAVKPCMRRKGL